ncbi:MAG: tetratricopeptide repeat-containing sulfotransferase family protein [Candidatus Methylumidiphilus sp.]
MSSLQRGHAAIQSQNPAEAAEWFLKAVNENPKDPQALACYGQSLCWLGRRSEGIAYLRQSGSLLLKKARKSRDVAQALMMVEQLQYWNDYAGALDIARQAVQINGAEVRGFQLLALTYSRLNQNKQALATGRQALRLAPDSAVLNILQATLESGEKMHEAARRRLEKVLQQRLSPEETFRAHKELARVLDTLGDYGPVFAHLHASAEVSGLLPEVQKQDAALVPRMIKANTAGFDRELLGRWAGTEFPQDQPAPVFLIGFMRSGTTLTQEVLGTHPGVFVADETDSIVALSHELDKMAPGRFGPDRLRDLDLQGVLRLRQSYWDKARARHGDQIGGRLLVDKTTMNTIDLGLINCVFPDAKVIFVMRDPRDVCLSCFMQIMIPTPSTVHLLTWRGTAEFYAQVMAWWMHVKQRLTLDFIEFRYEDAVADFEGTFRGVFELLALPWNPAVAEFHKRVAGRYIASPSFSQVAQPLYSSSVARWRHYAAEFAAVEDLLAPFIGAFRYGDEPPDSTA